MEVGPSRKTNVCIFARKISFPRWLWVLVVAAFLIFWGCSAFRHFNFCSEAFDLGIFSQAVWLISNREDPVSSLLHKHILGDHGAYVVYLISPIYKIFPTAYTLLAIQALVLALVPVPTYLIAEVLEVPKEKTKALCFLSVLHPTLNFFQEKFPHWRYISPIEQAGCILFNNKHILYLFQRNFWECQYFEDLI